MTSVTRRLLCVTTGIGVVGAAVMAGVPATASSPGAQIRALELTGNPFDPYVDLVTNTFANLGTIGTHWLEDPLPTLTQAVVNWFGYSDAAINAFVAAWQAFVDGLNNLPDQLQTLFDALQAGDAEEVFAELIIIVLSIFPIPALIDRLLAIPYDIVGNLVAGALAALHALQVPVGLAALSALYATVTEVGTVAHDFVGDLAAGDFAGAVVQLIDAPAQILDAALNSDVPGQAGLLTPFQDLTQTGFVDALVNYLPRSVAQAIGALYAPINDGPPALAADALDAASALLNPTLDPTLDAATTLADVAP